MLKRSRKGGAIIAVGLLAVGSIAACAPEPWTAEDLVPALNRPQEPRDHTPSNYEFEPADFDPSSTRLILEDDLGRAWVSKNDAGEVCVLLEPAGASIFGLACEEPTQAARRGINVGIGPGPAEVTTVVLLPQQVSTAAAATTLEHRWPQSDGWAISSGSPAVILLDPQTRDLATGGLTFRLDYGDLYTYPL